MQGARRLVEVCGTVKSGEKVLVVTDTDTLQVAQVIAAAAYERDAEVVLTQMTTRDMDEEEFPTMVAQAMKEADVVFLPTVKGTAHTEATRQALEAGARIVCLDQFHFEEMMVSGGLFADFERQRPVSERMAAILGEAETARVTSIHGTDIRMSIKGRPGNSHHCIVDRPGMFTAVPNIEANVAPVEGTAEGIIVFDASLPHFGIGLLRDPIRLTVKSGSVVKVEGGREARILARIWEECDDPAVYNIAQLAVGLNPECKEPNGIMLNDHGVYGSIHIGIGTSSNLGGHTKAATHLDGIMTGASLELDGVMVVENGTLHLERWDAARSS